MAKHRKGRRLSGVSNRQTLAAIGSTILVGGALLTVQFGTVQTAVAGAESPTSPTSPTTAPPPPPPLEPLPTAAVVTIPGRPKYRVAIPGWAGVGELLTNGRDAPLVTPGQHGRSVLIVPAVPLGPEIRVENDMWRVFRSGRIPESDLAGAVDAAPGVPTVLLVAGSGNPRSFVEAR